MFAFALCVCFFRAAALLANRDEYISKTSRSRHQSFKAGLHRESGSWRRRKATAAVRGGGPERSTSCCNVLFAGGAGGRPSYLSRRRVLRLCDCRRQLRFASRCQRVVHDRNMNCPQILAPHPAASRPDDASVQYLYSKILME